MQRLGIDALLVLLVLLLAGQSWAGFDEGVTAYKQGDYATALREFRLVAAQGDAAAQYNLGIMYENGQRVAQDYTEAVRWYRLAAAQGFAKAKFNLGFMYSNGRGVPQDAVPAAQWYRLAAEQGDADAQFNLGLMYSQGQGVPQDDIQAAEWYRQAAEQGDAAAQTNLGTMYDIGRGVPQDSAAAVRWYRLAAEQGIALAQVKLGLMYEHGQGMPQDYVDAHTWYNLAVDQEHETARNFRDNLARRMTPAQIAEAQRRANDWRKHKQIASDAAQVHQAREPSSETPETAQTLDVVTLQQRLQAAGYNPGPRDGIMGAKTRAALRQFQRDHGVPVTGKPDAATIKAMGITPGFKP